MIEGHFNFEHLLDEKRKKLSELFRRFGDDLDLSFMQPWSNSCAMQLAVVRAELPQLEKFLNSNNLKVSLPFF